MQLFFFHTHVGKCLRDDYIISMILITAFFTNTTGGHYSLAALIVPSTVSYTTYCAPSLLLGAILWYIEQQHIETTAVRYVVSE